MNQDLPKRALVGSLPCVDIQALRRAGLFEPGPPRILRFSLAPGGLELSAAWDPDAGRVELLLRGHADAPAGVEVVFDPRMIGGAYYFVCPLNGDRCGKLYFWGGGWAGRKALGLAYPSQYGPRSARYTSRLRALAAQLTADDGAQPGDLGRRAGIESQLRFLRRKVERSTRGGPARTGSRAPADFSELAGMFEPGQGAWVRTQPKVMRDVALATEMALERARALAIDGDDALEWLFRRCDAFAESLRKGPPPPAADLSRAPPKPVWDAPRISLRALAALGYVKDGFRRGAKLDWAGQDAGLESCNLVVDLRDSDLPYVGFELIDGRGAAYLAVRLERVQGRLAFVCPVSGARAETLAWREGVLGAPAALKLTRI